MNNKPMYPRGFMTPEGRRVSITGMARALRKCRANPDAEFPGWEWFPVEGWRIIRDFQRGLDERINARCAAQ